MFDTNLLQNMLIDLVKWATTSTDTFSDWLVYQKHMIHVYTKLRYTYNVKCSKNVTLSTCIQHYLQNLVFSNKAMLLLSLVYLLTDKKWHKKCKFPILIISTHISL